MDDLHSVITEVDEHLILTPATTSADFNMNDVPANQIPPLSTARRQHSVDQEQGDDEAARIDGRIAQLTLDVQRHKISQRHSAKTAEQISADDEKNQREELANIDSRIERLVAQRAELMALMSDNGGEALSTYQLLFHACHTLPKLPQQYVALLARLSVRSRKTPTLWALSNSASSSLIIKTILTRYPDVWACWKTTLRHVQFSKLMLIWPLSRSRFVISTNKSRMPAVVLFATFTRESTAD